MAGNVNNRLNLTFAAALRAGFRKRSRMITSSDCDKPIPETRALLTDRCREHGVCVHMGKGLSLWKFRNQVLKNMKAVFQVRSQMRKDLRHKKIVGQFIGTKEEITNPWDRKHALRQGGLFKILSRFLVTSKPKAQKPELMSILVLLSQEIIYMELSVQLAFSM